MLMCEIVALSRNMVIRVWFPIKFRFLNRITEHFLVKFLQHLRCLVRLIDD